MATRIVCAYVNALYASTLEYFHFCSVDDCVYLIGYFLGEWVDVVQEGLWA